VSWPDRASYSGLGDRIEQLVRANSSAVLVAERADWLDFPAEATPLSGARYTYRGSRTLEWPLVEARRGHVKGQISSAELPVRHEVWKFGSPHTLVLTKTDELFQHESKAREKAAANLEWLVAPGR
jgi:hypothetical protein